MFTVIARDETALGRPVSVATLHRIHVAPVRGAARIPARRLGLWLRMAAGKQPRYAIRIVAAEGVPVTTGPQGPAAGGDQLRAAHADREQVIDALKTAFVDGRLTKNELAARTGRALAARTYADLAALTIDILAEPAAAPPGPPRPPAPAMRRPLAKAAAISGVCLVVAAAAVLIGAHIAESSPGPSANHPLVEALVLLALVAAMTALLTVGLGVVASVEQRRSRRQLPPRPGPGGQALDGERHDGTSHDPVPPGPRNDQTRADLRVHKSQQPGRRIPARAARAPGAVSPAPGTA
jgi:Domain of unknown function (DUF1707)